MNHSATPLAVGYFGKIPGRGDFVKGGDHPAFTKVLDTWLAGAMDLMSADAHWKLHYDAVQPLHFALLGPRRRQAIAGHIVASRDQAGRRFPFLMMSTMEIVEPAAFVPAAPLVLNHLWTRLESLSNSITSVISVIKAADPAAPLQAAASHVIELDLCAAAHDAAFQDFLAMETIGAVDALLAQSGHAAPVRQVLLAVGLLLQPVMASSASRLEKSLLLPLPNEPMYRNMVAAFWMHLITPFLARADFELALFITRIKGKPVLVLGLSGASAETLGAIMDPVAAAGRHITFDECSLVAHQLAHQADRDYAIKKLSTTLSEPGLSLKAALESVCAGCIGT